MSNKKPAVMVGLMIVAMIVGSLFSIIWPIVSPALLNIFAMGNKPPPPNLSREERGAYLLAAMNEAKEKRLRDYMIQITQMRYGEWLFSVHRFREAKKFFQDMEISCGEQTNDTIMQAYKSCAIHIIARCDHEFYMDHGGKAADPQVVLAANNYLREHQPRHNQELDDAMLLGDIYCDNLNFQKSKECFDEALLLAKEPPFPGEIGFALEGQARVLANQGKTAAAEKLFQQALATCDTAYGEGSGYREEILKKYVQDLKKAGQSKRAEKIAQMRDYYK